MNIFNDQFKEYCVFLNRYIDFLLSLNIDYYKNHIFYGYKTDTLTINEKNNFIDLINKYFNYNIDDRLKELNVPLNDIKFRLKFSLETPKYINDSWLSLDKITIYKSKLSDYLNKKAKYEEYRKELNEVFSEEVLKQSFAKTLYKLSSSVTVENIKEDRKEIKRNTKLLKAVLLNKKHRLTKEEVMSYTNIIKDHASFEIYLNANKDLFKTITNQADVDPLILYDEVCFISDNLSKLSYIPSGYADLIIPSKSKEELVNLQNNFNGLLNIINEINDHYDWNLIDLRKLTIPEINDKLHDAIDQIDSLNTYVILKNDLNKYSKLVPFIDEVYNREIDFNKLVDIYCKAYYSELVDTEISKHETLKHFSQVSHQHDKNDYYGLDDLYNLISMARVREKASHMRPNHANQSTKSEVGILKSQKEKPTIHIKDLFNQISNLLPRIKPVILMSPLAVSTYLPSDIMFDIVIFDEASQILPEDAICSIYRGKQIVVVGDTEQLPPTDFFKKNIELDYENIEEEVLLSGKSLLDLCNSFLESVRLKWHYRSQNEELITFSNNYIYNNELVTFPASHTNYLDEGVEFYPTYDGIYNRGTTRTNPVEADKVSDLIIEHIDKYPNRSLGVVCFSVAQKKEILTWLNKKLNVIKKEDNLRYEKYVEFLYDEEKDYSFFVKNLENVQGDERDTIIFSICYGRDREGGELFYNLGKLTRDEGKKRINVAVSRSKINMKVVCSFDPNLIKISNNDQVGLMALKQFLVYAKDKTLEGNYEQKFETINDAVANDIKDFLEKQGYKVTLQLGKSINKIDVVVHNPKNELSYCLGIMLDGTNYKKCKTVRDREKLRELILEKMGWNIAHIYICDYVNNKKNVQKEIIKLLETPKKYKKTFDYVLANFEEEDENQNIKFDTFKTVSYKEINSQVSSDLSYNERFKAIVLKIIDEVGPIHLVELADIVKTFFGTNVLTEETIKLIKEKIEELVHKSLINIDKNYYYLKTKNDFNYRKSTKKRALHKVYYKELADLIHKIIYAACGLNEEYLLLEVLKYSSYNGDAPTNDDIENFKNAIEYLMKNNVIKIKNNYYYVNY